MSGSPIDSYAARNSSGVTFAAGKIARRNRRSQRVGPIMEVRQEFRFRLDWGFAHSAWLVKDHRAPNMIPQDDFVAMRAPSFNRIQQGRLPMPQAVQSKASKIHPGDPAGVLIHDHKDPI